MNPGLRILKKKKEEEKAPTVFITRVLIPANILWLFVAEDASVRSMLTQSSGVRTSVQVLGTKRCQAADN